MGLYSRNGTYYARWVEAGKRRRKSLRTKDRSEAERRFRELQGGTVEKPSGIRVSLVLDRWLKHQEIEHTDKPRTVIRYRAAARVLKRELGDLSVSNLTAEHLSVYKAARIQEVSVTSVNFELGRLQHALNRAKQDGLISHVPRIEPFRRTRKRKIPKILTDAEIGRLLKTCQHRGYDRLEVFIRLGLLAGLRLEEAKALQWQDVNFDLGLIYIQEKPGWTPKSHAERQIDLHPDLTAFLKKWKERLSPFDCPTDPVCPRIAGDPFTLQWLSAQMKRLFKDAGCYDGRSGTFHRCRHTFGTRYVEQGGDIYNLKDLLGHSRIETTTIYLHASRTAKAQGISRISIPISGDEHD